MVRALFAILCLVGSLFAGVLQNLQAAEPANVVLVTVDTLRADRLQPYGYSKGRTPTIQALADQGVLFENVLAQAPMTLPSHATILTGTYPHYHGVQDVVGRLRPDVPTLAEWFRGKGYRTAAFVGASVLMAEWGLNRGFDTYEDNFQSRPGAEALFGQGLGNVDLSRVERPAEAVVDLASEWLRANSTSPFFLWVHLFDPHDPYSPPEPFATEFRGTPYDGEIAYTDQQFGRLLEVLDTQGVSQNTLVVFTADHGESLGEHGETYHAFFIYDASIRIPLIIRVPPSMQSRGFRPGTRVENQVRSVDIAPTVVQLLGERAPESMQGEALGGLMLGRRGNTDLPGYAETHYPRIHFGWSPLFSYSTREYKYIDAPRPELYSLKDDPGELNNIYAQNSARANQMRDELYALQRRYASSGAGAQGAEVDPETMERLKSLGYVAFSSGSGPQDRLNLPDPKEKLPIYKQLNRAIFMSREGRSEDAIRLLEGVAAQEAEMPIVHFLLGSEYFSKSLFLKAAEEFRETIRRNPESNVARFSLARSWSQAGLHDNAEATLRELVELEPRHFGALHLLATTLAKKQDFKGAIEQEKKALEVRPGFAEGYSNLAAYYLQLGNLKQAEAAGAEALRLAPGNPYAMVNQCLIYLKQERFVEARDLAGEIIRRYPRMALGQFYRGQALQGMGDAEAAREAFRRAQELDPRLKAPGVP